ncbi:MAG: hypothetical protein JXD22_11995 [Sedimentisphaerales bacterium]|nr:hypothetical protein [Sedimentisphaerales bacterium]
MIMNDKNQYRYNFTPLWFISFIALLLLAATFTPASAQRGEAASRQQDLEATQIANGIKLKISDMILRDYLSQCQILPDSDIQAINAELEYADKFKGKFSNEQKSHLFLAQSLIAHYSGQPIKAIELAKKAYDAFPENSDMSAVVITLALYNEDYDTAKEIMKKIEAGFEVKTDLIPEELTSTPLPASTEPNDSQIANSAGEPNTPGATASQLDKSNAESPSVQKSKWSIRKPSTGSGSGMKSPGATSKPTPNVRPTSSPGSSTRGPGVTRGPGATGGPGRTGSSIQRPRKRTNIRTILDLPTDYMPYENLGDDFGKLFLRSVNGCLFYHDPGQGQLLCALLWTENPPKKSLAKYNPAAGPSARSFPGGGSEGEFTPGRYARSEEMDEESVGMSYQSPPSSSRPGSARGPVIAKAALDLGGNSAQFQELFSRYLPEGKAKFVGINFDPASDFTREQMINKLSISPCPWANCMLSDEFNTAQWKLHGVAGAVMLLVDTKGKVRYIGPVGGFLPKMLIDSELKKAKTEASLFKLAANMLQGVDLSKLASMVSAKLPARAVSLDPNDLSFGVADDSKDKNDSVDDTSADDKTKTATAADADSSASNTSPGKSAEPGSATGGGSPSATSSPQAEQILNTALLQKRVSTKKALEMCDEVLERWPDSKEANDAKAMIKSILRTPRGKVYKDLRIQQGKYVGDEG